MSRFLVGATWDDVGHLTAKKKAELWASIPAYQRDARTKGIPQLGAGLIYPFAETEVKIRDFPIPRHYLRAYAMDAGGGAKPTAAVFGALDVDTDVLYITSVYKKASDAPIIHATAIKDRGGSWMPGVGDCAALIMTQEDAEQLIRTYKRLGLKLRLPDKTVETGITNVYDRLTTLKIRVFASCVAWFDEFRLYRRDKHGRPVKSNDHLMDATRYLARMLEIHGAKFFEREPLPEVAAPAAADVYEGPGGWMR